MSVASGDRPRLGEGVALLTGVAEKPRQEGSSKASAEIKGPQNTAHFPKRYPFEKLRSAVLAAAGSLRLGAPSVEIRNDGNKHPSNFRTQLLGGENRNGRS